MKDGQVAEFDSPLALLHDKNSEFSQMVAKTGAEASHKLYQMAQETYTHREVEGTDSSEHQTEVVYYVTQV